MRSTTKTTETIIPADLLVEAVVAGTAGAAGMLAVAGGGPTGAVGTAASATDLLTGSAVAGSATVVAAGFCGCADGRLR
jgi:hypothetical protein